MLLPWNSPFSGRAELIPAGGELRIRPGFQGLSSLRLDARHSSRPRSKLCVADSAPSRPSGSCERRIQRGDEVRRNRSLEHERIRSRPQDCAADARLVVNANGDQLEVAKLFAQAADDVRAVAMRNRYIHNGKLHAHAVNGRKQRWLVRDHHDNAKRRLQ